MKYNYEKSYEKCIEQFWKLRLSIRRLNDREGDIKKAEKLLKTSLKLDVVEVSLSLCRILFYYYSLPGRNSKKLNKYKILMQEQKSTFDLEFKSELYYTQISSIFSNSSDLNKNQLKQINIYLDELSPHINEVDSYWFHLYTFNLLVIKYQTIRDDKKVIEICNQAITYFEGKNYTISDTVNLAFRFHTIPIHIQNKDFKKAQSILEETFSFCKSGSHNFHLTNQLLILKNLHEGCYHLSEKSLKAIRSRNKLSPTIRERYEIYMAYTNYMMNYSTMKFSISKFMNEVPTYSKDKHGHNVSIIIIQMLFWIKRNEFRKCIDRVESLYMYSRNHLKENIRSNVFIKMLLEIPKNNFHKAAVIRKTKTDFKKLQNSQLLLKKQGTEVEVVPYEILWKKVLGDLENKFHYGK